MKSKIFIVFFVSLLFVGLPLCSGGDDVTADGPVPNGNGNGDDVVGGMLEPTSGGVYAVLFFVVLLFVVKNIVYPVKLENIRLS
jgi:hypothetical protein